MLVVTFISQHPFVFARWFDVSLVFSIMLVACVDFMMTEFIKKAQHCHNLTALTGQSEFWYLCNLRS